MKKNNIATVVVTDIVGYSKLTGKNQDLALELLAEHDKIILKSISDFDGNVLVNRGDGFVAMFINHSNAVLCSMNIQIEIKKRNKFNIKNRKFNIRIGIHTGKYSKDKNDYHGECIDIASILEPLAPNGGILISDKLNSLIEFDSNIYTREYEKYKINNKEEITFCVYSTLIDWYLDKEKKIKTISSNTYYNKKSHELFHECDYSGSIKFSNSILETTKDKKVKFEHLGFLCNSFVSIGQTNFSSKLLTNIKENIPKNIDLELNGHFLKLEGHILFNNKKHSNADLLYRKSFELLKKSNSKYSNEVLFYIYINLLLSNNLNSETINELGIGIDNDEYGILIRCLEKNILNKKFDKELMDKVENIENKQFKSYGFWLLSKYHSNKKNINESYRYETLAQKMLKKSSFNISDYSLRDDYLKTLIIHQKILSESSMQIDDLIILEEDKTNNETINTKIHNEGIIFNYCVNCGIENTLHDKECVSCKTNLTESFYN